MSANLPELRPARAADLPAVVALLESCGLPTGDVTEAMLAFFCIAEVDGKIAGVAGVEMAKPFGLLRSVAVAPPYRGRGLARELVAAVEDLAGRHELVALYLLANDAGAASFFARAGYAGVGRARVPLSLRSLPEFSSLCPQSAPCLRKALKPDFDEASFMKTLEIFDPAMCCSTGVCGVDVDPALVQFAADLKWAAEQGVDVKRHNLGQEPQAFAANPAVLKEMEAGMDRLPIIVVDGSIVATGAYPSRAQLAQKLGIALAREDKPHIRIGSACCNPKSGCC